MEPQILDYYMEFPHSVNVIEKMNDELSEVQRENEELKQRLKKYETPKIKYKSIDEFNKVKKDSFLELRKLLFLDINYDMGRIINNTGCSFHEIITKILLIITNGEYNEWVSYKSEWITDCLNEKILTDNGFFEYLYEQNYIDERFLSDYFYKTIVYYLDDPKKGIFKDLIFYPKSDIKTLKKSYNEKYGGEIYIENVGLIEVPKRNTKEEVINIMSICGVENAKKIFNIKN